MFNEGANFIGLTNEKYYGVPSMNLTFRDYSLGDEEAYVNIWNESFRTCSWYSKHRPATIEGARKEIEKNRKESTYKLIFAILENRHIGFIDANMEDVITGRIFPYRPCILPNFRRPEVGAALVRVAMEHLRKCGAQKIKFSIMGLNSDTSSYIDLYQSLDFKVWRKAQSMRRSLDNIPDYAPHFPLKLLTARQISFDTFANLFAECFKDSSDGGASQIASNTEKTKQFIQQLREREGHQHDPEGWIAAQMQDKFVGFAIAIQKEDDGLIAEVGVIPQFRRHGIGTFLTLKALQRLKERGFKQAFLGVDLQNAAAISFYEKLGFEKVPWEIYELEAVIS